MKGMRRAWTRVAAVVMLAVTVAVAMTGCGHPGPPPSAASVLEAVLEKGGEGWPKGQIHTLEAEEGTPAHLTASLVSALYGEAARGWFTSPEAGGSWPVTDAALFLSTVMHPGEAAVFRCADSDGASSVAKVCRARLEDVKNHWRDSQYAPWTAGGEVVMVGTYVIMVIAVDPAPMVAAARQTVRRAA